MKKLSKAQIKVLKWLSKDGVVLHFMEGLNAYWFISGSMKVINFLTVEVLIKNGVIEEFDGDRFNKTKARITDKGRNLLADLLTDEILEEIKNDEGD